MRSVMHSIGLQYYNTKLQDISFVDTVETNIEGYYKWNMKIDNMVQYIYSKVENPSIHNYKAMVWSNFMMNCTVTIEDTEQS